MTVTGFRKMALCFEETDEKPHFDRAAFRVKGKIFATLLERDKTANLMLSPEDQYVFSKCGPAIYPVPNAWGRKGATTVDLTQISKALLKEMLENAYCRVAPKKLADKVRP
jgi:hypothetical protein